MNMNNKLKHAPMNPFQKSILFSLFWNNKASSKYIYTLMAFIYESFSIQRV